MFGFGIGSPLRSEALAPPYHEYNVGLEVALSSDLAQRFEDLAARAADIRGYL